MKENSIEEDITRVKQRIEDVKEYIEYGLPYSEYLDLENSFDNILLAYKRALKENEELKNQEATQRKINELLVQRYSNSISVQKVKAIIDRIDYDIKKTKEIISNNSNIYASYRKNDYQIVRLKAMNTKSLDIKKRLQKLLESEK